MSEHILYDVADQIATITINRPEKRNAMGFQMLGEFIECVEQAGNDDNARVVIVTGKDGSFCAGTDLADLQTIPGKQRGVRGRADEDKRWWPLVACPKPVIAAIDGPAVGMGAEFTSQCDIRVASTRSRFGWNFVHRGLIPDTGAGSWLLPRLIGLPKAMQLLYTGEILDAQGAMDIGYLHYLVEPEQVMETAVAEAQKILQGSPFSQRHLKKLLYEGLSRDVSAHMEAHVETLKACFASDDHEEGVKSFLERRPANFTGS